MIYNLTIDLAAILVFVTPALLIASLVCVVLKKPAKKMLLAALCSFCSIFILAFVGVISGMVGDSFSGESTTQTVASVELGSSQADIPENSDASGSESKQQAESETECNHVWVEIDRKEPTEEVEGVSYQKCENCGAEIQQPIPKLEHIVTFDEIYREYKSNELRADEKYKNNRYTITATINGMATGGLLNWSGGATLTMETRVDNTIVFFYAEFEKDQEEALKSVSVGDEITFEGECLSAGSWVECELK